MSRVTLDLPRVPFTWMRMGIFDRLRRCKSASKRPSNTRKVKMRRGIATVTPVLFCLSRERTRPVNIRRPAARGNERIPGAGARRTWSGLSGRL